MLQSSLKTFSLKNKKVLIRVDFNVPLTAAGSVADDWRIEMSLPTIKYVLAQGGNPILMSHLGRPNGQKNLKFSLAPCASALCRMLAQPVIMASDCVGGRVQELIEKLLPGESLLLENLRFHEAEENPSKNPEFAKALAELGEIYINDAFGAAHRSHSSTVEIVQYFKQRASCGFLFEKEVKYLEKVLSRPKRPFYGVIGGAKVSSKIGILKALVHKVDALLIGGAMAYTFMKAKGQEIGNSPYEPEFLETAKEILDLYKNQGVSLMLPPDHLATNKIDNASSVEIMRNYISPGYWGVDIGPETIDCMKSELKHAATIFWNGPLGIFEIPAFAKGTHAIARCIADSRGIKIVGGGDSVAAVRAQNLMHKFTHVSTGGGATLEFIENGTLPAIEALKKYGS